MKKGFLLTPSDAAAPSASDANLLQPIVTDECPVCLDPLNHDESIILTCRHMLCMPCTRSLWELRRATDRATVHLECPVCRTLVKVANGDLAAFCAAHNARNFLGPAVTPRLKPRVDPGGLNTLTVTELKGLVEYYGLQQLTVGQLEREAIEAAILDALPKSNAPMGSPQGSPISRLPVRLLRAILDLRAIPHQDCIEKQDLVTRVEQSARGSCMQLPASVLKLMLANLGCNDQPPHADHGELARQVMAARALRLAVMRERAAALQAEQARHAANAQRHAASSAQLQRTQAEAELQREQAALRSALYRDIYLQEEPPPQIGCCCIVS